MKRIRNILGSLLLVFLLLLTALNIYVYYQKPAIKKMLLRQLNTQLHTEVMVDGEMTVVALRNFPYVSLKLPGVRIRSATIGGPDYLLEARYVSLLVNSWDLLTQNYTIQKIIIKDGYADLVVNRDGSRNFDIFQSGATDSDTSFLLVLHTVEVHRTILHYRDYRNEHTDTVAGQDYLLDIEHLQLSGTIRSGTYQFQLNGTGTSRHLLVEAYDYLPNRPFQLNTGLKVHHDSMFTFNAGLLKIKDAEVGFEGIVATHPSYTELNLELVGERLDIEHLRTAMPDSMKQKLDDLPVTKGRMDAHLTLQGKAGNGHVPEVQAAFTLRNGQLAYRSSEPITNIFLEGSLTNGKHRRRSSTELILRKMTLSYGGDKLTLPSFKVLNFEQPIIHAHANGMLTIKPSDSAWTRSTILPKQGRLRLDDFKALLRFQKQDDSLRVADFRLEGAVELDGAGFDRPADSLFFREMDARMEFKYPDIHISDLHGKLNGNPLEGTIALNGFITYLRGIQPAPVKINAQLKSASLDLSRFKKQNAGTASPTETQRLPEDWEVQFDLRAGSLKYQKFHVEDLHALLTLKHTLWTIQKIAGQTMEGEVNLKGFVNLEDPTHPMLTLSADMKQLNIQTLFYQLDNFGQTTLTDGHLRGYATVSAYVLSDLHPTLSVNTETLTARADIAISDGELIDFKPITALSGFVNIDELQHIRFSTLKNRIRISNRIIHIPAMDIHSNALNLNLAGTHTFDNIMDYKVHLHLSEVLTRKFSPRKKPKPASFSKSKRGRLNLFLTITGPADDPKIDYDRRRVSEKIKDNLKKEQEEVSQVIKDELSGKPDIDTVKDWGETGDDPEFIDWEEDNP